MPLPFLNEEICMNNKNLFIASPIAGFVNESDYHTYKALLQSVIIEIEKISSLDNIYCELIRINNFSEYDSPATSVIKDIANIDASQYFLLLYPQKVVTSALIELGYAMAQKKNILIISSEKQILPYMVHGLDTVYDNIKVEIKEFTFEILINSIKHFIEN